MLKRVKGQKFGGWRTQKFLGEGGNGVVWQATNSSSEKVAIKLLTKAEGKRGEKIYARFKNEIDLVKKNSDIDGLLPILDSYLPDEIGEELPWYVMPIAKPLESYVAGYGFELVIHSILEIGKVLIKLHDRGISHRDIKPANILVKDDKFYLSDFGLVDYPDKQDLTGIGERIGAKWTIAPEMERDSQHADGKPADVYSLAKTLWILLTGRRYGFEGQYQPDSVNGLIKLQLTEPVDGGFFFPEAPLLYIKPLDSLMQDCTNDDPSQRPSMVEFVERLESWVQIYRDFRKRNPLQWQDIQNKLFPMALPQRVVWADIEDIVEILNLISSFNSLNHMLLPDKGGMDLLGASLGSESDTLELIIDDKAIYVVKPKRLMFESFGFDTEWNYFRLETEELEPTGLTYTYGDREVLVEIRSSYFVSRDEWEDDRDRDRKFPEDSRYVMRYIRGDFLILQKTSHYNRSVYSYDGKYSQMSADEFRQYIEGKIQLVHQIKSDESLLRHALSEGFSLGDLIQSALDKDLRNEWIKENKSEIV
ncbi:MAG: protein kinase [Ardenticatenaceae bacterium]|nr:protein kinase [Ardenticatenaceae bacterium]